jgi:hypothetical protein
MVPHPRIGHVDGMRVADVALRPSMAGASRGNDGNTGAEAILCLRALRASGDFDDYWQCCDPQRPAA